MISTELQKIEMIFNSIPTSNSRKTSHKIESKSNPNRTSTTDEMDATLATLAKELETYLALFGADPMRMWAKTAMFIDDDAWGRNEDTHSAIILYIGTHRKVDGNDWSCGQFGGRWADAEINGKFVRLCFSSKKYNPQSFKDVPDGRSYKILVDVIAELEKEPMDKKAEKRKRKAEEYKEVRGEAIQHFGGSTLTNNSKCRELMKTIVNGRHKSRGETVFFWHRGLKEANWMTNDDMRDQAKRWKKNKDLQFLEHNCQSKLVNGEEWHILVCGHKTEDLGIDPLGMGIDDGIFMVSGYIYWFRHKESRDTIFKYLTA
jgi:hypothetical protein